MNSRTRFFLSGILILAGASISYSQESKAGNEKISSAQCCVGNRGDLNGDGNDNTILDLNFLVNDIFRGGPSSPCPMEADLNSDGNSSTILDLNFLVNDIFRGGPGAGACETGLSADARMTVVDEAARMLDSLAGDPDVYTKIRDYLDAQPEIAAAEVLTSPKTVWAMFTDSVLLFVSNNRFPTGPARIEESPKILIEPPITIPAPEMILGGNGRIQLPIYSQNIKTGLPLSTDAVFMNTLGSFFNPITQTLANWVGAKGYAAYTGQETVEALRNISDLGVLFFSTHGGAGFFDLARTDSAYSLWTSTTATRQNLPTYLTDLRAKRVTVHVDVLDTLPNGTSNIVAHYGITSKFVTYYWPDFPENAMVYIDACGSDGPFAQPFKQAVLAKKAGVYFGWTYSVYSDASNLVAQFLIDRLLGSNTYQSYKENPPQRPFDYVSIYQDLQTRGLHAHPTLDSAIAPGNKTVFKYTAGQGDFGLLVPSIRYMAIVEHFDTLYVTGLFGHDPGGRGRVIVGGTELPVYVWDTMLIMCFIPNTGVGSVGPITVEIDGVSQTAPLTKRTSNVVNMTNWEGVFTYTENNSGSLQRKIEIYANLRADIHKFREYPHAAPIYYSVIFPAMESSYGIASAEGIFEYTWPGSDPVSIDTWTWDGTDAIPGLWENIAGFLMTGQVVASSHILKLRLAAATGEGLSETLVNNLDGFLYSNPISVEIQYELYDEFPSLFNINMNNVWDILGSQRVVMLCCSLDPDNPGIDDVEHKLVWPTIPAAWAPDTTAAQ